MCYVYKIKWTEYEQGWAPKPMRSSYFSTKEKADKAFDEAEEYARRVNRGPGCYINPSKPVLVEVDKLTYIEVYALERVDKLKNEEHEKDKEN